MITDVDVCNVALSHLQAGTINTLEDDSANAKTCRNVFDATRDAVMVDYPWAFATFIEIPTLISGEVFIGWSYLYAVPIKCLLIRKLFVDDSSTDPEPIEHRLCISPETLVPAIAVNYEDPYLEYTRLVVDPRQWSVKFAETMALRLAATIGLRLTGKEAIATELANRYNGVISEAKRQDAIAKHTVKTKTSSYEDAR